MEKNLNPEMQLLADKVKAINTAMLVTREDDGCLRSRPMRLLKIKGTDLLFLTGYQSGISQETHQDKNVNVSFADEGKMVFVSFSGKGTVSKDPALIEELWQEPFKAWFPEGKKDPNIAVLRIAVDHAEYWDTPSSPVVHVIGLVKAMVTGKPADPGDHEKLNINK
jgi:general stress protein 26